MVEGSAREKHDKLTGITPENQDEWNMRCVDCHSQNIEIHPVNIPYQKEAKTHDDLSSKMRRYYYNLPNLFEAIMLHVDGKVRDSNVLVECEDCGRVVCGFQNKARPDFGHNNVVVRPNKRKLKNKLSHLQPGFVRV